MDGFFSNCVNIDEVTHIFNWDSVEEIKIKIDVDRKSCIIALCTEDGMLTIEETNGSSLKIVKAIYDYVWKDVITEFKDSPILMWSNIENMGVKRKVFNTFSELSKYSEEKVKPLKVKKHLEALLKWAKSGNTPAKSKEIIEVHPLQKSNVFIHISYLFFKIKNANEEGLTSSGFEQAKALSLKWIANDKPSMEGIDDLFDNIHKIIEKDTDNKLFINSLKSIDARYQIFHENMRNDVYNDIIIDSINLIDRSKNMADVVLVLDMVCEALKPKNASLVAELISTTKLVESKIQKPVHPNVNNEKDHKVDSNSPIWKIIQYEFDNLNVESIQRKEFSEMILKKYPHIKKGTLAAQISIQVINKRARTGYAQCNKVRLCGDDKFDFLFENEDKSICRYQQHIHKSYEIYQRDDGKLDVRKLEEIKVENEEFWWEILDDFKVENKIVIVNIDRKDLEQNNVDSLKQIGIVENGDWEAFSKLTSKNEADLNKKDFGDKDLEFLVLLYCNGVYVTSINSLNSSEEDRLQ